MLLAVAHPRTLGDLLSRRGRQCVNCFIRTFRFMACLLEYSRGAGCGMHYKEHGGVGLFSVQVLAALCIVFYRTLFTHIALKPL